MGSIAELYLWSIARRLSFSGDVNSSSSATHLSARRWYFLICSDCDSFWFARAATTTARRDSASDLDRVRNRPVADVSPAMKLDHVSDERQEPAVR